MNIGDQVRLKSGGPKMTVSWKENGRMGCHWFDQNDELKNAHFHPEELTLVEDNEP